MKKGFTLFIAAALLALSIGGCNDGKETSKENNKNENGSSVTEISKDENENNSTDKSNSSSGTTDVGTPEESGTSSDEEINNSESGADIGDSTDIPELSQQREQIVATAHSLVGIDYTFSEASPEKGFDNSGFIYYVLRENGYINCPRGTEGQLAMGTKIGYDEVSPGDVVFFSDKDEESDENNYFGGIYVGNGKLIYSPYPGEKVKYGDFTNDYWKNQFCFGIKIA